MTKWLSKFTKTPLSRTDNADTLDTMSVLSVSDMVISVKNDHTNLCKDLSREGLKALYEERAAIFEYEGGFSRKESEDRAYQYTLRVFVSIDYPDVMKQFEALIKKK